MLAWRKTLEEKSLAGVTIRRKPVWERIKKTAQEKGIELTFDAVKALGKAALTTILGS